MTRCRVNGSVAPVPLDAPDCSTSFNRISHRFRGGRTPRAERVGMLREPEGYAAKVARKFSQ